MMGSIRLISILLSLNGSIASASADIADARLKQLRTATSMPLLERTQSKIGRLEEARAGCEVELAADLPPTSCFSVLKIERELFLIGNDQARSSTGWLESICRDRAQRQNDAGVIRSGLALGSPPTSCGNALRRRLAEIEYLESSHKPVALFRSRLR